MKRKQIISLMLPMLAAVLPIAGCASQPKRKQIYCYNHYAGWTGYCDRLVEQRSSGSEDGVEMTSNENLLLNVLRVKDNSGVFGWMTQ